MHDPLSSIQVIFPKELHMRKSLQINISVADMIVKGGWKWPLECYDRFLILKEITVPVLHPSKMDTMVPLSYEDTQFTFTTRQVWCDLEEETTKVDWLHVIWFSHMLDAQS